LPSRARAAIAVKNSPAAKAVTKPKALMYIESLVEPMFWWQASDNERREPLIFNSPKLRCDP
jgi:hypothetical protein